MNSNTEATQTEETGGGMDLFGRYLSVWVALAIVAGVALGQFAPSVPETLSRFEVAQVSIPIAILIWAMIFPMMAQIDFSAIVGVRKEPKGLAVTTIVNWLIKPFTMFALAWFFLMVVFEPFIEPQLASEYLAGAILLLGISRIQVPWDTVILSVVIRRRGERW